MKAQRKAVEFFKYLVLALLPILSIYDGISFVNLGELLLFAVMIAEILINKGSFDVNGNLFIIIMFLAVLNIVTGLINMNIISFTGYWHNSIDMILVAAICAYFVKSTIVKKETFYRFLKVIALLSSFFLIVQYYFYCKGIVIYGFLPFLNISGLKEYSAISISYGRPNSFFLEPAHYAIYVLPVYAIALSKKQYITSFILLTALFLSTSTTGIVTALSVTVIFAIEEKETPIIIKWIVALAGSLIILQFIPIINQSSIIKKISFINLQESIRVFGVLSYFKYLNIKELLLGVGINEISAYMKVFANLNISNYSNSFFFSFLSFGILGGAIWNSYIISLNRLYKNKILYILFILVYFSDQILFNSILVYLLLVLYVFSDSEDDSVQKSD